MPANRRRELRGGKGGRRARRMAEVVERDGQTCWLCGEHVDLTPDPTGVNPMRATLDHVDELANGGSNAATNLRLAHQICNERRDLTDAMRDLLWTAAQMKHGWAWVSRHRGETQVADALVRRGLVAWCTDKGRGHHQPRVWITEAGKAECARRWPVSPFVLGTYEPQPGGWTPRAGVAEVTHAS